MPHSAFFKPGLFGSALSHPVLPEQTPVARQIRSYYNLFHTETNLARRQEALLRVQQALEPLTATLISSCSG